MIYLLIPPFCKFVASQKLTLVNNWHFLYFFTCPMCSISEGLMPCATSRLVRFPNPIQSRYASRASSMLSLDFKGTERPLSGCRQTLCGSCRWKCGGCRWKCGSCRWKCGSVEVVDAANSCRLCGRPPNGFPLVFPGGHWRVWLHLPLL